MLIDLETDLLCKIFRGMTLLGRLLCKKISAELTGFNKVALILEYSNDWQENLQQRTNFLRSFNHLQFTLRFKSGDDSLCVVPRKDLDFITQQTTGLTSIDIRKNGLGRWGRGSDCLRQVLTSAPYLQTIDAADNELGHLGARHLSIGMAHTTRLLSLDMSHNRLGDDGLAALSRGLSSTVFLTNLVLARNSFGPVGATHLAQALTRLSALTALNVAENVLGPAGGAELAAGLRASVNLVSLSVGWNSIGPAGTAHILHFFRTYWER